jgi:UV DNA damage endonuclease
MNLGYCCINLSLKQNGVSTNRSMIKATFSSKGKNYAGELALLNLQDLKTILRWNLEKGILIYRMSSDIFPWMSEYRFEDLSNFESIRQELLSVGSFINNNGIRVSFHPGQFDVLASPNENIVQKTVYDLDQHSKIMDLMGLPQTHQSAINIHIGGSYGDKQKALSTFCKNFELLSPGTKARLVVENDDKASQYGVKDLYDGVYKPLGCPITFDHFHHLFCSNDLDSHDAAHLAASTWGQITPLQHYSSSRRIHEDSSVVERSHADYIYESIQHHGIVADVELEAKAKDLALLKYLNDFS